MPLIPSFPIADRALTDAVLHSPRDGMSARMTAAPSPFRVASVATGPRGRDRNTRDRVNFLNIREAAAA
jgi:hypothetical protein